ncbi:hypothetical protein [Candidatus Neoehrlichia procyonis]|uniref:Uncharacterized protein n=1 Tax=Candidatus Neoehrlichia procyonis str. RAC413 TaxID=1359163 RepID=A0A0F3NQM0_9RICK|nr:hypothetical protein [Candidatus Neoehrlichia lotoris]KJV69189.1 hypothetical protein NLO413_0566 [Candidatus Neoehrlichia lotoris str. RAC413]
MEPYNLNILLKYSHKFEELSLTMPQCLPDIYTPPISLCEVT